MDLYSILITSGATVVGGLVSYYFVEILFYEEESVELNPRPSQPLYPEILRGDTKLTYQERFEQQAERDLEERLALFARVGSDLEFSKMQQWRATNYGLLIYAGFITLLLKETCLITNTFALYSLSFLGGVVLGVAWYLLNQMKESIKKGRRRLTGIYNYSSHAMKVAWGREPLYKKPDFTWIFIVFLLGGDLVLLYLINQLLP